MGGNKRFHGGVDRNLKRDHRSSLESSEVLLELRPTQFDRIKVRGVWRQVAKFGARGFDEFANTLDLVRGQVVHNDNLTGLELWAQYVFQISQEDIPIGRRFNRHCGYPPVDIDGSQHSQRTPTAGRAVRHTLPHRAAPVPPSHLRRSAALIQENQVLKGNLTDRVAKPLSQYLNTFTILLGGV